MTKNAMLLTCLVVASFACGNSNKSSSETKLAEQTPTQTPDVEAHEVSKSGPTCAQRAEEIRSFFDRARNHETPMELPWPTGDDEYDARIRKAIAALGPADPAERQRPLSKDIDREPDQYIFRDCPEGLRALEAVAEADPDARMQQLRAVTDGVEACGCKINDAVLKTMLYWNVRGPAMKTDTCTVEDCWL
jgi:hypothetical protein